MDEYVRRLGDLKDGLPPVIAVLLYGSHARGDCHEDSDVDVAVVFDAEGVSEYDLLDRLRPCWPERLDPLLFSLPILAEDMSRPELTAMPGFYNNVQRDGIVWPMDQ